MAAGKGPSKGLGKGRGKGKAGGRTSAGKSVPKPVKTFTLASELSELDASKLIKSRQLY